ncbi:MAG: hypothetical protein OXQ89_06070 [Rhodospirillaceae bacterium]|nr:hypothetical protein [Rhodospirillaceae bacterium]
MHHEYAVEPAAIGSSWETFRYIFEKFGFQNGRLISRFPNSWPLMVLEAASEAGIGDLDRKKIEEKLRQGRRTALIRMGRHYDPALGGWVENAAASHASRPFRGVIAQQGVQLEDALISSADLEDDHPQMLAPRNQDIPRTIADIARACSLLLHAARVIDFVDPYFNFVTIGQDYRGPLERMMRTLHAAGKANVRIRIHYSARHAHASQADILDDPGRWVNLSIPEGYELHLYAWQQREGGERLHDRFLLCDCGGMQAGIGFAASQAGEYVKFSLLDNAYAQQQRLKFTDGSTVYAQDGRGVRVKSNGEAEFI